MKLSEEELKMLLFKEFWTKSNGIRVCFLHLNIFLLQLSNFEFLLEAAKRDFPYLKSSGVEIYVVSINNFGIAFNVIGAKIPEDYVEIELGCNSFIIKPHICD